MIISDNIADIMYVGSGDNGPTVSDFSDVLASSGMPDDAIIVGVLIYAKNE